MERLTERSENGKAVYRHPTPEPEGWEANRNAVLERCCQYEDTGLTPEEIMDGKMLTGWIPVEEKLPRDGVYVLATCQPKKGARGVNRAYYSAGYWHGSGSMSGVIAWMPLPEPYRPETLREAGAEAAQDAAAPLLQSAT